MAFPLLALLLLTGQAAVAGPAPAPAPSEVVATSSPAQPADTDYLPQGAPTDDYSFVAWCGGVLSGHMDIAERVKDILPIDDAQQTIGRAYLRAYDRALAKAPQSKTAEGKAQAEQARQAGWNNWDKARAADKQLAADTYLGYQLPGRCEHAAVRLSGDQNLFKKVFSAEDEETVRSVSAADRATPIAPSKTATAKPPPPVAAAPAHAVLASAGSGGGLVMSDQVGVAAASASEPEPARAFAPAPVFAPAPAPAGAVTLASTSVATPASTAIADPQEDVPAEPAAVAAKPETAPAVVKQAPAAKPTPKPAPPKPETDDSKIVNMPSKGHLLPGFLRKKKD